MAGIEAGSERDHTVGTMDQIMPPAAQMARRKLRAFVCFVSIPLLAILFALALLSVLLFKPLMVD